MLRHGNSALLIGTLALLSSSCAAVAPLLLAGSIDLPLIAIGWLLEREVDTARRQAANKQFDAALDTLDQARNQDDQAVQSLRFEIKSKMRFEPRLALRLATRELKAKSYTEASEDFAIALRGNLTSEERVSALNGHCLALTGVGNAERAYQACAEAAKDPGGASEIPGFLEKWARELRTSHGQAIEAGIAQDRGSDARQHWRSYKELHGADPVLVGRWDKEIAIVERRNEEEAQRQEQIREAQREEMRRATRERLLRRYGFVTRFNQNAFERWVESATTVLGAPIFNRAEISGGELRLWLNRTEFFGPNLRMFADYSDAFAVWCKCSAVTYVGVDYSYLGGKGETILIRFVFDPEVGQSVSR